MADRPVKTAALVPRQTGPIRVLVKADRFEVRGDLGAGSTGVVWRVLDRDRGHEVALRPLPAANPEQLLALKDDFRALAEVRHPHVVRVHELVEIEGRLFVSMEIVDGLDLMSWLWGADRASGQHEAVTGEEFSEQETTAKNVLPLIAPSVDHTRLRAGLAQLTDALTALHAAGCVHGDLRPSNVLVTAEQRLVVLDFAGAARRAAQPPSAATAPYLPPEASSGRMETPGDWYAVGVLLYEALTGRTPFVGKPAAVMQAKVTSDPPPPSALVKDVPPELDHLCERLLRRDTRDRAGAADILRVLDPARKPRRSAIIEALTAEPSVVPRAVMPLVGRQRELGLLAGALGDARRSQAVLQVVTGTSGIGKTALIEAFARQLSSDALVLLGRCHERETMPFKALDGIIDGLARRLGQLSTTTRGRVLPDRADLLAELFPVLRRVEGIGGGPQTWRGADPGELRLRAFATLRELLGRLAQHTPLVLIIDDLHGADLDSLDLLAHILRLPDSPRLLVVAAGRPSGALDRLRDLATRGQIPTMRRLELGPMPTEEAELLADVAASHLGIDLSSARAIALACDGHPGFILELVRAADSPDLTAGAEHVPTLDELLTARLARLDDAERVILDVLALAGPSPIALVAAATHQPVPKLLTRLDGLVDGDLVVASGRSPGDVLDLYHDRLRDALLAQLGPAVARELHGALATTLEGASPTEPARLMYHWAQAGQRRRAVDYAIAAARAAAAAFEFHRAGELYRIALAEQLAAEVDRRTRIELAEVLGYGGRSSEAAVEYLAAAGKADRDQAVDLQRRAADALFNAGEIEQGSQLMTQVLGQLGITAGRGRFGLIGALFRRKRLGRPDAFVARASTAISGHDLGTLDALATAELGLGLVDPWRAFEFHVRYLELARATGEPNRYARGMAIEAVWRASSDPADRDGILACLDAADGALTADAPILDRVQVVLARGMAGALATDLPDARAALDWVLSTLAMDCRGAAWETRTARMFALWVDWQRGDLKNLSFNARRWLEDAVSLGDVLARTQHGMGLMVLVPLIADDVATASSRLDDAAAVWAHRQIPIHAYYLALGRALIALYQGDGAGALAVLDAFEKAAGGDLDQVQHLVADLAYARARAWLLLVERDRKAGLAGARAAARTLARSELPYAKAVGHLVLGCAEAAAGDSAAAEAAFGQAVTWFDRLDMAVLARVARYRRSRLRGGAVGTAEGIAIIDDLAGRGARAPERLIALLAP